MARLLLILAILLTGVTAALAASPSLWSAAAEPTPQVREDWLRQAEARPVTTRSTTRADAAGGLTDIRRLADMLTRVSGRIAHRRLAKVSPLAVPVLLEIGKEAVYGAALDDLLDEAAQALIEEATADEPAPQLPL